MRGLTSSRCNVKLYAHMAKLPKKLATTPAVKVLDTNVLLTDPNSINKYGTDTVVIPDIVLFELDTFKKDSTELGRNARQVARDLDGVRTQGCLQNGLKLTRGGV